MATTVSCMSACDVHESNYGTICAALNMWVETAEFLYNQASAEHPGLDSNKLFLSSKRLCLAIRAGLTGGSGAEGSPPFNRVVVVLKDRSCLQAVATLTTSPFEIRCMVTAPKNIYHPVTLESRVSGAASTLLTYLQQDLIKRKAPALHLTATPHSLSIWKHMGFTECDKCEKSPSDIEDGLTPLVMTITMVQDATLAKKKYD